MCPPRACRPTTQVVARVEPGDSGIAGWKGMTGGGRGREITAKSVQILGGTTVDYASVFGLRPRGKRVWAKRGEGELLV